MQGFRFDDRAITWQTVEYLGAEVYVVGIDEGRGIADVLIRFRPNTPRKLHRHVCDFTTFVVQGELRFWREDGAPKEVRPVGSCVQVPGNGAPHSEGAGDEVAVVLFSFRGSTGDMVLYLDDTGNTVFRLGFPDFRAVMAHQVASGAAAKLAPRAA